MRMSSNFCSIQQLLPMNLAMLWVNNNCSLQTTQQPKTLDDLVGVVYLSVFKSYPMCKWLWRVGTNGWPPWYPHKSKATIYIKSSWDIGTGIENNNELLLVLLPSYTIDLGVYIEGFRQESHVKLNTRKPGFRYLHSCFPG